MSKKLWEASNKTKLKSNLLKFENLIAKKYKYRISKNYNKLLKWSIKNP